MARYVSRIKPHIAGGMVGAALLVSLYLLDIAYKASGGFPTWALLLLPVPGAISGLVAHRGGHQDEIEREGALTGLVMGHTAAVLLTVALMLGAFTIDWDAYGAQVGVEVAGAVRDALVPAALIAGAISLVVVYAGCVTAGWLGALIYKGLSGWK